MGGFTLIVDYTVFNFLHYFVGQGGGPFDLRHRYANV